MCHSAASLSKALATVMVPLWGSILKALPESLRLSIEYLGTEQQDKDECDFLFCCQEAYIIIIVEETIPAQEIFQNRENKH